MDWKNQFEQALAAGDRERVVALAGANLRGALRVLNSRLYGEPENKWRAVAALGWMAARQELWGEADLTEQMRRFFWALNDESGAVPYGIPEAIGELLAVRPSLQPAFLPLLCALAHHEDAFQTGPIETGVYWALGRVGPPVAICSPEAVEALEAAAGRHPDGETRRVAAEALARIRDWRG